MVKRWLPPSPRVFLRLAPAPSLRPHLPGNLAGIWAKQGHLLPSVSSCSEQAEPGPSRQEAGGGCLCREKSLLTSLCFLCHLTHSTPSSRLPDLGLVSDMQPQVWLLSWAVGDSKARGICPLDGWTLDNLHLPGVPWGWAAAAWPHDLHPQSCSWDTHSPGPPPFPSRFLSCPALSNEASSSHCLLGAAWSSFCPFPPPLYPTHTSSLNPSPIQSHGLLPFLKARQKGSSSRPLHRAFCTWNPLSSMTWASKLFFILPILAEMSPPPWGLLRSPQSQSSCLNDSVPQYPGRLHFCFAVVPTATNTYRVISEHRLII